MDIVTKRMQAHAAIARWGAAEGMVLLKNEGDLLPLSRGTKVALFGVGQIHTIKGGTGSGEVNNLSSVNFLTGLQGVFQVDEDLAARYLAWTDAHPMVKQGMFAGGESRNYNEEMPLEDVDLVALAAENQVALFVISRIAGEGEDLQPEKGTIYLTDAEEAALSAVTAAFEKTVLLLNTAGYMEIAQVAQRVTAVVFTGLPGQEGGHALADVLTGAVPVGGRLSDTWPLTWRDAYGYEEYSRMIPSGNVTPGSFGAASAEQTLVPYHEDIYVGYRYYDTFGKDVLYPFGYGLSYGKTHIQDQQIRVEKETLYVSATVANESTVYSTKEVVQAYVSAPEGRLEKPYQELKGYQKTGLLAPGEAQQVEIAIPLQSLASYDPAHASWILEPGLYYVRVGAHSRATTIVGALQVTEELTVSKLENKLGIAAVDLLTKQGAKPITYENEAKEKVAAEANALPITALTGSTVAYSGVYTPGVTKAGVTLQQVIAGDASAEELAASMALEDLATFVCGIGMDLSAFDLSTILEMQKQEAANRGEELPTDQFTGLALTMDEAPEFTVPGEAGQTPDLSEKYGLVPLVLADGPAGVRLTKEVKKEDQVVACQYCTAFPTGSLLACTFDPALIEEFGQAAGVEMNEYGVDLWLAPGMNIHRSLLCGRNFEYYSEDPLVSGRCAGAVTRGVQSQGVGVTVKHFAGNQQEFMRASSNDLVSERALREIYLKGFELCVTEASPLAIMTAYNDINGVPSADNRELLTDILREEWGFDGLVMTDWGGGASTPAISMYAGNDMIQPGGKEVVAKLLKDVQAGQPVVSAGMARVTHVPQRADLEKSAAHIIRVMVRCKPCRNRAEAQQR